MTRLRNLSSDRNGSAAVEFGLAVPVLVTMIWGMFQVGLLFEANSGMQQALGEAARYATIYPTPSDTQIQTMITNHKFGLGGGTWSTPTIDNTNVAAANGGYKVITVTYSMPTSFIFFTGPSVSMTKTKRVYLSV